MSEQITTILPNDLQTNSILRNEGWQKSYMAWVQYFCEAHRRTHIHDPPLCFARARRDSNDSETNLNEFEATCQIHRRLNHNRKPNWTNYGTTARLKFPRIENRNAKFSDYWTTARFRFPWLKSRNVKLSNYGTTTRFRPTWIHSWNVKCNNYGATTRFRLLNQKSKCKVAQLWDRSAISTFSDES